MPAISYVLGKQMSVMRGAWLSVVGHQYSQLLSRQLPNPPEVSFHIPQGRDLFGANYVPQTFFLDAKEDCGSELTLCSLRAHYGKWK